MVLEIFQGKLLEKLDFSLLAVKLIFVSKELTHNPVEFLSQALVFLLVLGEDWIALFIELSFTQVYDLVKHVFEMSVQACF